MSRKHYLILLFSFSISGCFSTNNLTSDDRIDLDAQYSLEAAESERAKLIGTWYRDQLSTDGELSKNIAQINEDGSYLFHFHLTYKNGEVYEYREKGLWGYSSGYHFTIKQSESSDGEVFTAMPTKSWLYRILKITHDTLKIQTISTKNIFTYERVDEDFTPY